MKVLVFQIGPDRYGLPLTLTARVLPVMEMKRVPLAPDFVAGLIDLHGNPVPVIDLSRLAGIVPDQVWHDTRIILVHYPAVGGDVLLGLLAEHVTGIADVAADALQDSGIEGAPFLGQVASDVHGMLQLVQLDELLAPDVRALLFPPREAQ
ncbi:MAG: chemotaxis protein CheW [Pseudomonadota bacterium]